MTGEQLLLDYLQKIIENPEKPVLDVAALPDNLKGVGEFLASSKSFEIMIKQLQERKAMLEKSALTDGLTGIANRMSFMHEADALWKQGKRFYVTFIDLDDLKLRNDNYGHAEGDRYIRYACNFIRLHLLPDDRIYRMGGDEFVIVSFHGTIDELEQRMENIRTLFAKSLDANTDLANSFSYGCSVMNPIGNKTVSQLLGEADEKMYAYKAKAKAARVFTNRPIITSAEDSGSMIFEALSHCAKNQYIFISNMDTNISHWSPSAVRDFNLPGEYMENAGDIWCTRIHPEDRPKFIKDITEVFTGKKLYHDIEYRAMDASGNYVFCSCRGCMLQNEAGEHKIFAGVITNHGIIDNIDPVTNLHNVYEFIDNVDLMRSEGQNAGFLVIGLSQFDSINSSYGYRVGNQVLKRFASALQEAIGTRGNVYRLDGAKYVMTLPNYTKDDLLRLYNRLRSIANKGVTMGEDSISLLFNGAALLFKHIDLEATTILSELQYALNISKQENNGELVYFDDQLHGRARRSMEILDTVKRSVFNDCRGFYMVYQPQVDRQGRMVGAEALLRWRDDLWGMVYPDEYIPALENSLCFNELGQWILRTALTEFKTLLAEYPDLCLSVNISYRQLEKRYFCRDVIKILQETGFPANKLVLELTEHCHSMSAELLRQKLDFLRENKIRISADDFGTGYSSMHMLREITFDEIKLEKSFVLGMNDKPKDRLLIEAIIDCAKKFDLPTCAEGVETLEHFNKLRELGVNRYQGYYFSKPVALPELKQYILIHNG